MAPKCSTMEPNTQHSARIHVYAYMCTHTCVRIHVYAYMCTYTCVGVHERTCMCTLSLKKIARVLSCLTAKKMLKLKQCNYIFVIALGTHTGRSWKKLARVQSCMKATKVMKLKQCSTHNTPHTTHNTQHSKHHTQHTPLLLALAQEGLEKNWRESCPV